MHKSNIQQDHRNCSLILHGGAISLHSLEAIKKVPYLIEARELAWEKLMQGETAEQAVVAAVRVMEKSEYFNAGYGGYPNVNGIVLQDIGLMRGDRSFVSLLNIRRLIHPSAVALEMLSSERSLVSVWTQELMEKTDNSSQEIKDRYGWVATHQELLSPYVTEILKHNKAEFSKSGSTHGTVGCVARDQFSNLAACTCTGGVNTKQNGRIGDSPMIGSGVFADNEICALSTTGYGESFLQSQVSSFVTASIREKIRNGLIFEENINVLKEILSSEFNELERKCPSKGGAMIVIPKSGLPDFHFNSAMASIAYKSFDQSSKTKQDAFIATKTGQFLRE